MFLLLSNYAYKKTIKPLNKYNKLAKKWLALKPTGTHFLAAATLKTLKVTIHTRIDKKYIHATYIHAHKHAHAQKGPQESTYTASTKLHIHSPEGAKSRNSFRGTKQRS